MLRLSRECHRGHLAWKSASFDGEYHSSVRPFASDYNNLAGCLAIALDRVRDETVCAQVVVV